jgi:hypothetical protein
MLLGLESREIALAQDGYRMMDTWKQTQFLCAY